MDVYTEETLAKKKKGELIDIILDMSNQLSRSNRVNILGKWVRWSAYGSCRECVLSGECRQQGSRISGNVHRWYDRRPCNGFGVHRSGDWYLYDNDGAGCFTY